jgi:hypothetical protein
MKVFWIIEKRSIKKRAMIISARHGQMYKFPL